MGHRRSVGVGLAWIVLVLCFASGVFAQEIVYIPPTYPMRDFRSDPSDPPHWVSLENDYIRCNLGVGGNWLTKAFCSDEQDGGNSWARGDKVFYVTEDHNWRVAGRYGVVAKGGDPETSADNNRPLTFMGMFPCHYFGYMKLRLDNSMRMIGGAPGNWYSTGAGQPVYTPQVYRVPPPDMVNKEKTLGVTGPFIRGIWETTSDSGMRILVEIRIHLVRDLVRFEYKVTNAGSTDPAVPSAYVNVGFCQNGDVEVGDPIMNNHADGGTYGPYDNANFAYVVGSGGTQPATKQSAMMFGGYDPADSRVVNPPVPEWFEVYDDVQNPINVTRNVIGLEDATKPDFVAVGEYNDLFHRDMWPPTDYKADKIHNLIRDMCWVLCWSQKGLAPGATRTIVTYYGVGAATSRWTYLSGKNPIRDQAVLAVTAPRSIKYNSTALDSRGVELSPSTFSVKAYLYNLATDPGPYDLRDAAASIYLPKGLELVDEDDNAPTKPLSGVVGLNSESEAVVWNVRATGEYAGDLPIFVSVVDSDPSGRHWQQSVSRKIYVPAAKRGLFHVGWQLMNVPFSFSDFRIQEVFGLQEGLFSAKYYDVQRRNYQPLTKLTPGQAFWMYADQGQSWGHPALFTLAADTSIVGEASGTGKQTLEQRIPLTKGWNLVGNPFVYPVYWGQVMVYSGGENITLDEAYRSGWIDKTLFSYNTDKGGYDISSDAQTLLNPWKGYWITAYRSCTLIIRPPLFPAGDVTAYPGGN